MVKTQRHGLDFPPEGSSWLLRIFGAFPQPCTPPFCSLKRTILDTLSIPSLRHWYLSPQPFCSPPLKPPQNTGGAPLSSCSACPRAPRHPHRKLSGSLRSVRKHTCSDCARCEQQVRVPVPSSAAWPWCPPDISSDRIVDVDRIRPEFLQGFIICSSVGPQNTAVKLPADAVFDPHFMKKTELSQVVQKSTEPK